MQFKKNMCVLSFAVGMSCNALWQDHNNDMDGVLQPWPVEGNPPSLQL